MAEPFPSTPARMFSNRAAARQFPLGQTFATPAVQTYLADHGVSALALLSRHARGDWGVVCKDDRAVNDNALKDGSRLLSVYDVAGERIWVITEAESFPGHRASTCILFPREY